MKQSKVKVIKTKTGALSKSAGFPGKDMMSTEVAKVTGIKEWFDKVFTWSKEEKATVPPLNKNNKHLYWE